MQTILKLKKVAKDKKNSSIDLNQCRESMRAQFDMLDSSSDNDELLS